MELRDVAPIVVSVAWPVTVCILVFYFRLPLKTLLARLADSLTVKTLKLKVLGSEVELTPERAKEALDELLGEILESTNDLSPDEIKLFQAIRSSDGRRSVEEL